MGKKAERKKPGGDGSGFQEKGDAVGRQLNKTSHNPPKKSRLNRREAIRARCLDCSGFSAREVRECPVKDCSLYPYRLPKGKQDAKARDKAIRDYCRECMNGQKKEVVLCPSKDCPLHPYRHTKAKKEHIDALSEDKITSEGERPGGSYA